MSQPKLSDLAAELGVNKSTVSRALRGDPQIAAATADRIRRHAEARGYQRDPSLSALAESRWRGRPARVNWGFLVSERALGYPENRIFCDFVKRYAEHAGYALDITVLRPDTSARELNRLIDARALRGILVNPIHYREAVAALDFSQLRFQSSAWVFCGEFFFEPPGHRVVENFFANMMIALDRIARAGYRRIAFVYRSLPLFREARGPTRHRAAALEFARAHPEVEVRLVPVTPGGASEALVGQIGGAEMVLLADMPTRARLPPSLQTLPYAMLNLPFFDRRHSGIRRVYDDLAMSAVDVLDLECRRYSRGVPARRHTLVVEGEWQDGETLA